MTADKIALKAELYDLFVNLGFGAAYICDDTVILYDILLQQLLKKIRMISNSLYFHWAR